ncbi:hypothetical protein Slin15195_G077500 [Septoria linicola]|uniref:Uncharacterized protein n=1 Tax=Septoria linicola TaxID=215465 RepID=A0A9Q9B160_9PEZI|nr:hypothetical protein Slin14017_G038680 [Septoria linicola]USW54431.1 hypothetical protein Slin15195_G077500 [Septoria linicola]
MADFNNLYQAPQHQRSKNRFPIINGPAPYYDPPWPAQEEPSPLAIRLQQLRYAPPSEIGQVPVKELIEIRTFQENILDEYGEWASQQRFGRAHHLAQCAKLKNDLANMTAGWIQLSEGWVEEQERRRALESVDLAKGRFSTILTWREKVRRASESGYSVESDEDDEDLQEYQSVEVAEASEEGYGVPAAAAKTKVRSTEKQSKVTKTTTTRRQKVPTKSKNEALLASLQASVPKESGTGFRFAPPLT